MKYYGIEALDTLFFGDGSPFDAGETGQIEVTGVFPPSPTTVVGALRAAFARELGWRCGDWPENVKAKLGDGQRLGPLRFAGPYVTRGGEPLFPAPLYLMKSGERFTTRLRPRDTPLETDMGEVRLPEVVPVEDDSGKEAKGFKPLADAYLTKSGTERALRWELPQEEEVVKVSDLWEGEGRLGIRRDPEKRTTQEDALYLASHVRPRRGVALAMGVAGYEGPAPGLMTLGGESRMAYLEPCEISLPEAPELEPDGGRLRYTVTLLTPMRPQDEGWQRPGGGLAGLPGEVVSACVGKPVLIGGWDTERKRPLDLEPHLPAGSTWFMETEAGEVDRVLEMHAGHIGAKTEWGYGQILIGRWR
ncbi:conserved hypothetical protein [Rubrobacter xylanophilus DSM 9941]|uniref:Type III-B CRISPR module-associated protein Cmr3 n=1 Tax=Rubrobacter xylanophilus (strain DSM 9941 / JCM 11954 / NBRC 16129 / PRD-1) TaxID=266117 RepID=Q1AZD9_RUBXD|nr:type III-B CRISPR module-associated protein Cmr3 [Rubrobacter xylanophilus]ABG03239.1 conserved hypothetical protein [Rubrobacter xylanophilus DSM 9941]